MPLRILSYQRARAAVQLNFYADPSTLTPQRIPPSRGQQIDLTHGGEQYRLQVFAIGSWRYRVHLDGRVVAATLREERGHTARLQIGERTLRLLYDVTEVGLRVEVEGHAHRFGSQAAGHVRASTPAMVVSIDVEPGDRVTAGQSIGLLEAMKMEIGFDAPVTGVVTEVRVRKGQQVAAGDVLLVIDPSGEEDSEVGARRRLQLRELPDPLERLFRSLPGGDLGEPDLLAADRAAAEDRRSAIEAVREEVRRVLLGYDANRERSERLSEFLEAPLPDRLSGEFRRELAELRHELVLFADVARLSVRSPRASVSGELGPSNSARLRSTCGGFAPAAPESPRSFWSWSAPLSHTTESPASSRAMPWNGPCCGSWPPSCPRSFATASSSACSAGSRRWPGAGCSWAPTRSWPPLFGASPGCAVGYPTRSPMLPSRRAT